MKKLGTFVVLLALSCACALPLQAGSKTQNKYKPLNSASRKADKKQAKTMRRYAKAQKKAERKMLKTERKNSTYKPNKNF